MLTQFAWKKIIVCSVVVFAILLIYLIPDNETLKIEEKLEYVDSDVQTSTIYLLDSNNYLAKTKIVTKENSVEKKAKELINALIIDGDMQDKIPNGFKAIIPTNTKILSLKYDNDLIKIDLSSELMDTDIKNEERIVEAIVYTLTSIDNVKQVIIYMDGNILTKLPKTKITLPSTLDRSYGINKEYNVINKNNINKTTIYYISEYNDEHYYVPVTKVNNDNREKIEIIIDELSSSNVYKTNLMSYLNSNTKIMSIDNLDDELVINFNDSIFNDINTKDILEEVIYTISLSVNDNYNVENIVFNVNNEEIYKSVLKGIE